MSKKKLPEEEIVVLTTTPYTLYVTPVTISFTEEFMHLFWPGYQERLKPTDIFRMYGYDPDILGQERISGFRQRLKEGIESNQGFYDERRSSGTRKGPTDTDGSNFSVIRYMKQRLSYLDQEVDFLKKFHRSGLQESSPIV